VAATVTTAVVSWNTRELLLRCLQSLQSDVEEGVAQVWVVDNGSSDGSAAAAREAAPWAEVLEPGENLGFGRAVNLVAERSDTPWLACANADVAPEPGALRTLLEAGEDERVGCVAPRLVLPDGSTQFSLHSLPTLAFTLALNLGLHRLSRSLLERMLLPGYYDMNIPRDVAWAVGAFLLLRRSAFDAVGGFDARQWMYAEDLDLGWRLRDGGWITRYEPRARVLHAWEAATAGAFGEQRRDRFTRATYAVIARRRGPRIARLIAAINVLGAGARVVWMTALAVVLRRWRGPLAESRRWLSAHRQGLRRRGWTL